MEKRALNRKGQEVFGMSFGMIFAIILIIFIIATAFYVIRYFLNLQNCTETSFLYDNMQKEVDRAWKSNIYSDKFSSRVPSGIEAVCFGDLNAGADSSIKREIGDSVVGNNKNVFLYPVSKSCGVKLASYNLKNADISGFFCINTKSGKLEVNLTKGSFDALPKLSQ